MKYSAGVRTGGYISESRRMSSWGKGLGYLAPIRTVFFD